MRSAVAGVMGGFDSRVTDDDAQRLLRGRALCPGGDHGPRAQARHAHRCLASLRARCRSGIAASCDGARDRAAAVDRGRQGRSCAGGGKPRRLCRSQPRFRCVVRASRACSVSRWPTPKSSASSPRLACRSWRRRTAGGDRRRAVASISSVEEDLIEEVARIHGYDNMPTHTPAGELTRGGRAGRPPQRIGGARAAGRARLLRGGQLSPSSATTCCNAGA